MTLSGLDRGEESGGRGRVAGSPENRREPMKGSPLFPCCRRARQHRRHGRARAFAGPGLRGWRAWSIARGLAPAGPNGDGRVSFAVRPIHDCSVCPRNGGGRDVQPARQERRRLDRWQGNASARRERRDPMMRAAKRDRNGDGVIGCEEVQRRQDDGAVAGGETTGLVSAVMDADGNGRA